MKGLESRIELAQRLVELADNDSQREARQLNLDTLIWMRKFEERQNTLQIAKFQTHQANKVYQNKQEHKSKVRHIAEAQKKGKKRATKKP